MIYEQFALYSKSGTADPPQPVLVDGVTRHLTLRPLSDNAVIGAMARGYDPQPTHIMRGAYDSAYITGRVLRNLNDQTYWMIVSVEASGRRQRGQTHAPEVRLRVARHNWGDSP